MKKTIIYLLVAVMLLTTLAACGKGNTQVTPKPTNTSTATMTPDVENTADVTHNATNTPKPTDTSEPTGGVLP